MIYDAEECVAQHINTSHQRYTNEMGSCHDLVIIAQYQVHETIFAIILPERDGASAQWAMACLIHCGCHQT